MKTAKAHRKFAIYSIYLDTWLEGEEEVADGETRKDTLKRILKDLVETAADLKKEAEAMNGGYVQEALRGARESFPPIGPAAPQVIDYKKIEQFEKDIDNAQTSEELEAVVKSVETFPGRLLSTINAKRQSLKNMTNGK